MSDKPNRPLSIRIKELDAGLTSHVKSWEEIHFPVGSKRLKRCRGCLGRGMVSVLALHVDYRGRETLEIGKQCEDCNGTGTVPKTVPKAEGRSDVRVVSEREEEAV